MTLRKLAEAATPGPWVAGDDEDSDYFLVGPHDGDEIVFHPVVKLHPQNNAYYIAAANPAAILALLDTIDSLTKVNASLGRIALDGVKRQRQRIQEMKTTIDVQRALLERAKSVLNAEYGETYDEPLEVAVLKDITTHLDETK